MPVRSQSRKIYSSLRKALLEQSLSQVDLVRATGIPASSITHYCQGHTPPADRRRAIAKFLGVPISKLWAE